VRTGISSHPHDVLEANPLISVSISSGVSGEKNIEFIWHDRMYFYACISLCRSDKNYDFNTSANNFLDDQTFPSILNLCAKLRRFVFAENIIKIASKFLSTFSYFLQIGLHGICA